MNLVETLLAGASELGAVLTPHGFHFVETGSGRGSGGHFASGEFRQEDRRLELHLRYSLGLVAYHLGSETLAHADYVRAVRAIEGIRYRPLYPGFSEDPLDGFRHLRDDFIRFGRVYTQGSSAEFAALVAWVREHPAPKGLAALR
jgi:hypothetical protein